LDLELRKKLVKCYVWSIAFIWCWNLSLRAVDQKHLESFEVWTSVQWWHIHVIYFALTFYILCPVWVKFNSVRGLHIMLWAFVSFVKMGTGKDIYLVWV
jgi:hypothetical protein